MNDPTYLAFRLNVSADGLVILFIVLSVSVDKCAVQLREDCYLASIKIS